jgi:hypothetical protein
MQDPQQTDETTDAATVGGDEELTDADPLLAEVEQ